MRLKVSSAKWHPFCLGLNVLRKYLYKRAMGTIQCSAMVSIINSSAMLYMLLLFCDMKKIIIVLATIIIEEKSWGNNHVYPNSSRQQILFRIQEKFSKEFLESADGTIGFNM